MIVSPRVWVGEAGRSAGGIVGGADGGGAIGAPSSLKNSNNSY